MVQRPSRCMYLCYAVVVSLVAATRLRINVLLLRLVARPFPTVWHVRYEDSLPLFEAESKTRFGIKLPSVFVERCNCRIQSRIGKAACTLHTFLIRRQLGIWAALRLALIKHVNFKRANKSSGVCVFITISSEHLLRATFLNLTRFPHLLFPLFLSAFFSSFALGIVLPYAFLLLHISLLFLSPILGAFINISIQKGNYIQCSNNEFSAAFQMNKKWQQIICWNKNLSPCFRAI